MTEAMSWTRLKQLLPWLARGKTERMPGQKLAWPGLALVWPQAWSVLWGWPGLGLCGLMCLPGSLSVAWVCESCLMLLAGPLTCLTITLDRHHNPMFTMLTKGCKKSKGMCIFSKDRQQNEIVTQQTTFLTERVAISSFPPQSPDSPTKMKF